MVGKKVSWERNQGIDLHPLNPLIYSPLKIIIFTVFNYWQDLTNIFKELIFDFISTAKQKISSFKIVTLGKKEKKNYHRVFSNYIFAYKQDNIAFEE